MVGKHFGGRFTGVRNAQRKQEGSKVAAFALLNRLQQVVGFLFAEAVELDQIIEFQRVQVGRFMNVQLVMQLLGGFFAERLDVHRIARREMRNAGDDLRFAAQPVVAEQMGAALLQRRAACRAHSRKDDLPAVLLFRHFAENFRDDVVGTADEDAGAKRKLQVFPLDVANVVERAVLHGDTGQLHRLDLGQGRDFAGTPDVPGHGLQHRGRFFRLKFERHRPTREFIRVAENLAGAHIGNFDDGSVDQVIERSAALHDPLQLAHHLIEAAVVGHERIDFKTVLFEKLHHLAMVPEPDLIGIPHVVEKSAQLPLRRDARIQVAQGAGRGVAGVFERFGGRFVVFGQYGQIHDAFALHFDRALTVRDGQRHGLDRFHLGQNTFAHNAVPPGRRLHQVAVRISQVQRQSIELQLDDIRRLWEWIFGIFGVIIRDQLDCPVVPVLQLLLVLGLIQAP